jgi:hypothetical protein
MLPRCLAWVDYGNPVNVTETMEYLQFLVCEFNPCVEANANPLGLSWHRWGFATGSRPLCDYTGYIALRLGDFHVH